MPEILTIRETLKRYGLIGGMTITMAIYMMVIAYIILKENGVI